MDKRFRLLVIEDEDQDYRLLLRYLESRAVSFDADRASGAQELREVLKARRIDWNLILADHSLPDIDIRTELHWLMSKMPNVPVIMVSGSIGEENAVELLLAGVHDFVSKDNLARLVPAMERALEESRIRAAQRAAEAELQLRNRALEAASNGIVIARADGDRPLVYVNPAFERITGYREDQVLGRNCRLLQREDRDQPGVEQIRQALAARQACQVTLRNYRHDGSLFWNRLSIAPVSDPGGKVTHYVGIQEDISDQVEQQQRLRQSATVFDHALEGMVVTDVDGTILEVNRAFSDITGYSRDEVVGDNPRLMKSGRHDHDFYRQMWESLLRVGQWSGEVWNRRKSGEVYPQLLTIGVVRDEHGDAVNYVGVFADISRLKQSEQKLEFLAHHDALTELPNRLLFNARLEHAVEHAQRNRLLLAVLFLDIDRFKNINDAHGHVVGDELLRQVGTRLGACLRTEDTLARIGGDEFIVLLEHVSAAEDAARVAEKMLRVFGEPFEIEGLAHFASVSIGVSMYPRDAGNATELVRNADTALYHAKEQGRNTYRYYLREFTEQAAERSALENDLHRALINGEFALHYQPQVAFETGQPIGVEALLRWQHPERGRIGPNLFIPVAEETGRIIEIGAWVLETACLQARDWLDADIAFGRIAVNIAGPQIRNGDLHEVVERALRNSGLPPERLELEVTESFVMRHVERSIDDLRRLRDLGVHLAIDDFGTGYSSLSYLKRLPVHRLKIDQSFVRDLPDDPEDAAITGAIIALGRSLGLDVVAEGVETEAQRRFLIEEGCANGQGYLYMRPASAEEYVQWLAGDVTAVDCDTGN